MRTNLISIPAAILIGALCLAACAGGGGVPATMVTGGAGGNLNSSLPVPVTQAAPGGDTGSGNSGNSPGAGGSTSGGTAVSAPPVTVVIGAPAVAGYGQTPIPAQFAVPDGPSFDPKGETLPVANTSFPALTSAVTFSGATSADTSNASVTVTVLSATPAGTTLQFAIPSVGLIQATTNNSLPTGKIGPESKLSFLSEVIAGQLNYVSFGIWSFGFSHSDLTRDFAAVAGSAAVPTQVFYAFGYETPAASMPSSGAASFHGTGNVVGRVWTTQNFGDLGGDASFSVDFASGKIDGAFTNMWVSSYDSCWPWHDVSVKANIAPETNKFSGTTAVTSQPSPSSFSLTNSATGHINGAFYGPAAQNLGALWSLSDGTGSALGWVGASH